MMFQCMFNIHSILIDYCIYFSLRWTPLFSFRFYVYKLGVWMKFGGFFGRFVVSILACAMSDVTCLCYRKKKKKEKSSVYLSSYHLNWSSEFQVFAQIYTPTKCLTATTIIHSNNIYLERSNNWNWLLVLLSINDDIWFLFHHCFQWPDSF